MLKLYHKESHHTIIHPIYSQKNDSNDNEKF